ncbi:MAG: hypothetical protein DDT23_00818 [candidate division WS2 bacterium]|nr:hypothetical protein [Candidatus Lithacetigena glycinireducens]
MRKTFKYRLLPTKKQLQKLNWTLDKCRILYNSCLLDRKNRYEQTGKGLTRIKQQGILRVDKKIISSLKEVHSQVLQDVLFRVDRAFQNFFRRVKAGEKPGYPRFKNEGRYDSFCYPQSGFKITEQGLKLSKIGTLKIKLHRQPVGTIKTCVIKREIDKWYVCFSVEYEPVKRLIPAQSIGIDVGIKSFAVLSDGTVIDNPKHLCKSEQKLISLQRQLSKKKKKSCNRKKARKIVAKLHCKVCNKRSDFHHKVSRKLVNNFGFVAVEDLNIKGMVKNHRLAKHISDAGWGQFLSYLQYKAAEASVVVEKVSPHYTSINCSVCGEPVPKTLAQRIHSCPFCETVMDRDHNAAQNILLKSTAGTAESNAWGEAVHQCPSLNQEASSIRVR